MINCLWQLMYRKCYSLLHYSLVTFYKRKGHMFLLYENKDVVTVADYHVFSHQTFHANLICATHV